MGSDWRNKKRVSIRRDLTGCHEYRLDSDATGWRMSVSRWWRDSILCVKGQAIIAVAAAGAALVAIHKRRRLQPWQPASAALDRPAATGPKQHRMRSHIDQHSFTLTGRKRQKTRTLSEHCQTSGDRRINYMQNHWTAVSDCAFARSWKHCVSLEERRELLEVENVGRRKR